MLAIDYQDQKETRHSLKEKLVAAVANGNEIAADELRMMLRIHNPVIARATDTSATG